MVEPRRVQLSRKRGWRMPEGTLKVDRTTQWGNECTIEDYGSAEKAVDMFDHGLDKFECFHPDDYRAWIKPLVGKSLACWCKLPKSGEPDICHADVLLRRAREFAAEESRP